ncbi:hypothetical protein [Caldicellulosiruptor acetigenus]|nr:hypothetical protein [Caldicellulosiruptor acetigenus]
MIKILLSTDLGKNHFDIDLYRKSLISYKQKAVYHCGRQLLQVLGDYK